jgi:hypothetical protein
MRQVIEATEALAKVDLQGMSEEHDVTIIQRHLSAPSRGG